MKSKTIHLGSDAPLSAAVSARQQSLSPAPPAHRSKVKTNGHLIPYMSTSPSAAAQRCGSADRIVTGLPPSSPFSRSGSQPPPSSSSPFNRSSPFIRRKASQGWISPRRAASPCPSSTGSEVMSRLGLLFGAEARRTSTPNDGTKSLASPRSLADSGASSMRSLENPSRGLHPATASPVSTLTGKTKRRSVSKNEKWP